jgi:hypothetical protein
MPQADHSAVNAATEHRALIATCGDGKRHVKAKADAQAEHLAGGGKRLFIKKKKRRRGDKPRAF